MDNSMLNQLYKAFNKYAENNKGESPISVSMHISKRKEFQKEIYQGSLGAVQFNSHNGSFYVFGVRVFFSKIMTEDEFIISDKSIRFQ